MKKITALLLSVLFSLSIYAADGMMWGEKNLRVSSTQWFDIIYPAREEAAASILFENADRIYYEIAEDYGFPPQEKMPVVIVPGVENFNAFWTVAPYNHIVIYNTEPIEQLEVFSEKLLSTFKHELTHAFTYNMKNKFWKGFSSVFGDAAVPGQLLITSGMAESATLASESNTGEGRLNDEYSNQMVRQAKIESKFPSYFDVQGAATNYPGNSFYYFNGAFAKWLQDTYGMDKYARYWYKCVNLQAITPGAAFKSAFGISYNKAWKKFESELKVPDVAANPVGAGIVRDFFNQTENKYNMQNKRGSIYNSLSVSEKGFAYVDAKTSSVYFVPESFYYKTKVKPKKLFYHQGLDEISLSQDGNFLVISYLDDANALSKHKTAVYGMNTKQFFYLEENNSFKPSIIKNGEEYYYVYVKFTSPVNTLCISKIQLDKNGKFIKGVESLEQKVFELNDSVLNLVDIGNGQFAYIKISGLDYSICISDLEGNLVAEYKAPVERMCFRNISPAGKNLIFSWTKPGSMPRLGSLNLENGEFSLSTEDISGGVYSPVLMGDSGKVAYVGKFFRENRLFVMNEKTFEVDLFANEEKSLLPEVVETVENEERNYNSEIKITNPDFTSKPYNSFKYLTKGIFVPFSTFTSNSYAPGRSASYPLPLGVTFISGLPWTDGAAGLFQLTAGYGVETNSFGVALNYAGGTDTSLFKYSVDLEGEVDFTGWKQANETIKLNWAVPFGKSSFVTMSGSNFTQVATGDDYFITNTVAAIGYANMWYNGPGKYDKAGFGISLDASHLLNQKITGSGEIYKQQLNLGSTLKLYIPHLLPFDCINGFSYNLPVKIRLRMFPSTIAEVFTEDIYLWTGLELFEKYDLLTSVGTELILFACDIQKGVWCTPLFINDLKLSFVYNGVVVDMKKTSSSWKFLRMTEYIEEIGYKNSGINYMDTFGLKLMLGITPNFGLFASRNYNTNVFTQFGFAPNAAGLYQFNFSFGLDARF